MAVIFDHLTAILVGTALLGVLFFVQQRSSQSAVQDTIHHNVQTQTSSVMDMLQRDLDNMRSEAITGEAQCVVSDGSNTRLLLFHTLADPTLGEGSPIVAVAYSLENTAETLQVNGHTVPAYKLVRYTNGGALGFGADGGSSESVTGFEITLITDSGHTQITNGCTISALERIRVEATAAHSQVRQLAGDQQSTNRSNQTRHAFTARPSGLYVDEGTPPAISAPSLHDPLPIIP